ncbi:TIGR02253 family HAD-type hydrolase [Candidatus Woesearchaeota archaeon]|nr:TIGR02253 family HAD-type hydrolase [Candidatus Woesearchaeota archaeon]
MLKAIIFDLDNTLIDFRKFKHTCCEKAISAMIRNGLKIPKKQGMDILYKLFEQYSMEDKNIFQKFLKKITGEVDYQKLAIAVNAYRRARIGILSPYPGTKKVLSTLNKKGYKLAIVSDAPKLKAYLRLTAMKIENYFDVIVTLEDTGRTKPSKLPFKAAISELKVKPSQCLMVGDMPHRDMKGAKKLGMKTCFAKYGYPHEMKKKAWDYEINEVSELLDIIEK